MKQFFAFVKKEFFHVFRDSKTLLMLFGLPIAQIMLFGFALTNEIKNSKIIVCDYANDECSRAIISKLASSPSFKLDNVIYSENQIETSLKRGKIKLAIIFPRNFSEDLARGGESSLKIIADASDPNTATTLVSFVQNIVNQYQIQSYSGTAPPYQIIPEIRMLYNPELKGATNFVPGVMALVLMLVCVLMTSVSIVREKETGTMELLLVSPINPFLIIIAKVVPYFFLSILNLSVILILSVTLLDMPIQGSLLLLYGASGLLILTCLSLGLFISNITTSQQSAMLISLMGMLIPTLLLTGFMFPIENMPLFLQVISNIIPSKWYYIIVKAIMIKGLGIADIWRESLILLGMTLFLLLLSFKKFKIRLS